MGHLSYLFVDLYTLRAFISRIISYISIARCVSYYDDRRLIYFNIVFSQLERQSSYQSAQFREEPTNVFVRAIHFAVPLISRSLHFAHLIFPIYIYIPNMIFFLSVYCPHENNTDARDIFYRLRTGKEKDVRVSESFSYLARISFLRFYSRSKAASEKQCRVTFANG